MTEDKRRCGNITNEQKTLLTEFMGKHPLLISGKFNSKFTLKDAVKLWENITLVLNAADGAGKSWKAWRKSWQDLRSRSKSKQANIKRHQSKTGGGPASEEILTATEEHVLSLIGTTAVDGHADTEESQVRLVSINEFAYTNNEEEYEVDCLDEEVDLAVVANTQMTAEENMPSTCTLTPVASKTTGQSSQLTSQQIANKTTDKSPRKRTALRRLEHTMDTADELTKISRLTYDLKAKYYEQKIELYKRNVEAKERIACALEEIANRAQSM